jgi:hypothetical protein
MKYFDNEYSNEKVMIEHTVDIGDLQMVYIEMDIYFHSLHFSAMFEDIFHKIIVYMMNMIVVSIRETHRWNKTIHCQGDHH